MDNSVAIWLSGLIALVLLFMHKYFTTVKGSSDVQTGVASSMFWLLLSSAGWAESLGNVANIYFYFFLFGIGMSLAVLISALNFSPTKETNQERQQSGSRMDGWRERMGWRPLKRR